MQFNNTLLRGKLIKRYKRFLSDHLLDTGEIVTAHCPNPGAMLGLTTPESEVWLSPANNPNRKLKYTWELIRISKGPKGLVGINTNNPNRVVAEALVNKTISELREYSSFRPEVPYGTNSRIDFLLTKIDKPPCYLEVKNVHLLRKPACAEFPDSVTSRGTKHLRELTEVVKAGSRAIMLYLVQREDCEYFSIANDIDSVYASAFNEARASGVETICYDCKLNNYEIILSRSLPIEYPKK